MNHERPVPLQPIRSSIESAIAKQVVLLDEKYVEDQTSTVVIPDEKLAETKVLPEQSVGFEKTQEGRMITALQEKLWAFRQAIGVNNLSYAVYANKSDSYDIANYQKWVEDNKLRIDLGRDSERPIDFVRLDDETQGAAKVESQLAIQVVRDADTRLEELRSEMASNPQFGLGKEVAVLRNARDGKEAYIEKGWQVSKILASGLLRVLSPDQRSVKDVSVDKLQEWATQ